MDIRFALPPSSRAALLAVILAWASPALALDAKDVVGLWKTVDASSAQGKAQGGVMFRRDGTGIFFDAPWDAGKSGEILKLLTPGNSDLSTPSLPFTFSYTVENELITTHVTRSQGIAVQGNTVHWKATLKDDTLRMETTDGVARWAEFALIGRGN